MLDELDPFLANLDPVIRYLEFQKSTVTDFLQAPGVALSGQYTGVAGDPAPRHGLRQLGYISPESLSIWPSRLPTEPRQRLPAARRAEQLFVGPGTGSSRTSTARTPTTPPVRRASSRPTDEEQILPGQSVPGVNNGDPPGTTPQQFAPCYIQGDFPGTGADNFGSGRNPELFTDP